MLTLLLISPLAGFSQEELKLPDRAKTLSDLIPHQWLMLDSAFGDLNRDGIRDMVFVISDTNPSNLIRNEEGPGRDTIDVNPRILGIYFGMPDGSYIKQEQADQFILKADEPVMDDPFSRITISPQGVMMVEFRLWSNAGSWHYSMHTYHFRFANDAFELIHYDTTEIHRGTLDQTRWEINFNKLKMKISHESDSENTPVEVHWIELEPMPLKTLESLKQPFQWKFHDVLI